MRNKATIQPQPAFSENQNTGGSTRLLSVVTFGTLSPPHLTSVSRLQMQPLLRHQQLPSGPNFYNLTNRPKSFSDAAITPAALPWEIPGGRHLSVVIFGALLLTPPQLAPVRESPLRCPFREKFLDVVLQRQAHLGV